MGELTQLTDIRIRNAKPQDKLVNLSDGGGCPCSSNLTATGTDVTTIVSMANSAPWPWAFTPWCRRRRRGNVIKPRAQLAQGMDPMAERKVAKLTAANDMAEDVEAVARALWTAKLRRAGCSASYVESITEKLEKDVFPLDRGRPGANLGCAGRSLGARGVIVCQLHAAAPFVAASPMQALAGLPLGGGSTAPQISHARVGLLFAGGAA